MYCPQCGAANEDGTALCETCGTDLQKFAEQWSRPAGQPQEDAYGQPSAYQPPASYAPSGGYVPPYQQQHQPTYQAPPYPYYSGYSYQPEYNRGVIPNIPSYLGWAIATLILCFWPTGIVAVVHASRVGDRLARGDIQGAQESSHKAKTWTWITFGIGLAGAVLAVIAIIVAGAAIFTLNT
jgi:hypothetical protein